MEPKFFEIIVQDQQYFADKDRLNTILFQLSNEFRMLSSEHKLWGIRKHMICQLYQYRQLVMSPPIDGEEEHFTSEEAWERIETILKDDEPDEKNISWEFGRRLIVLALMQPKVDESVSIEPGHLLTCPFALHPVTMKPCLPFVRGSNFNPDCSPTAADILENPAIMEPYLKIFRDFCSQQETPNSSD